MFHRSMSLGRVYKSTLRSASSQNLIKATADVILFPQICSECLFRTSTILLILLIIRVQFNYGRKIKSVSFQKSA